MAVATLEQRLKTLENEVAAIRRRLGSRGRSNSRWWETIAGAFENDPNFDRAMRLGATWRKDANEKSLSNSRRSNGRSRHRSR